MIIVIVMERIERRLGLSMWYGSEKDEGRLCWCWCLVMMQLKLERGRNGEVVEVVHDFDE